MGVDFKKQNARTFEIFYESCGLTEANFLRPLAKLCLTGIRLQGDWGEIVDPEGSKSPLETLKATKTLPSIFAIFIKASTCAKQTF